MWSVSGCPGVVAASGVLRSCPVTHTLADSLAIAGVVAGRVLGGGSLREAMGEVRVSGALRAAVVALRNQIGVEPAIRRFVHVVGGEERQDEARTDR